MLGQVLKVQSSPLGKLKGSNVFKVVYRRHTNFAIESIEQVFTGTADFGRKVTCTISRNGDLINQIYLQVQFPALSVNSIYAPTAPVVPNNVALMSSA